MPAYLHIYWLLINQLLQLQPIEPWIFSWYQVSSITLRSQSPFLKEYSQAYKQISGQNQMTLLFQSQLRIFMEQIGRFQLTNKLCYFSSKFSSLLIDFTIGTSCAYFSLLNEEISLLLCQRFQLESCQSFKLKFANQSSLVDESSDWLKLYLMERKQLIVNLNTRNQLQIDLFSCFIN